MKSKLIYFIAFCFIIQIKVNAYQSRKAIDIVYTLDLSGSTNGLIDDVRDKIFDLSNRLNHMRPAPDLRIGVVAYGRPSYGANNQFVKIICPLTNDFNYLASELYKIKSNIEKGETYVGAAIRTSVRDVNWAQDENAYRAIYIIGNGHTNQGSVDFRRWSEEAKARGIVINAVYCKSSLRASEIVGWTEIASTTGGQLFDIQIHSRLPNFIYVQDFDRLVQLSQEFTNTYISFGNDGANHLKQITDNIKNAYLSGPSTFEALIYSEISDRFQGEQEKWDLIDYINSPKGSLAQIDRETLPKQIRFLETEQLKNYIKTQTETRKKIVAELRLLLPYDRQDKANAFFNQYKDKNNQALENVLVASLKENLTDKGITINNRSVALSNIYNSRFPEK